MLKLSVDTVTQLLFAFVLSSHTPNLLRSPFPFLVLDSLKIFVTTARLSLMNLETD